tara:strand:+ start:373 stop:495 length:123 start_codon:yes stop_codon:yes gene_type:complete
MGNIDRDIKETKRELYRLQAKLERLEDERMEAINKLLEEN